MNRIYLYFILFLTALSVSSVLHAQTIMNVEASIREANLVVNYDVAGLGTGQLFDVKLYSSSNNYTEPVAADNLEGAVGDRIGIQSSNEILIKNPLDVLQGVTNVNFKVRLVMVFNPVTIREPGGPTFNQKFKKPMTVLWRGGLKNEPVKFNLFQNDSLVMENIYAAQNNGSAEFKFPKVKKGAGYQVKMDFESMSNPVELPPMTVKPKKSVAARVINILLLAAVVDFALYAATGEVETEDELGGFIFKNFDPLGLVIEQPPIVIQDPDLPDAPDAPSRAMITIPLFR